ncbi:MAG: hypothetical protein WCJ51_03660 [Candidatus Moraniibacteriota bacterium]
MGTFQHENSFLSKSWTTLIKSIFWILFKFEEACDNSSEDDATLQYAIGIGAGAACLLASIATLFYAYLFSFSYWYSLIWIVAYLVVGFLLKLSMKNQWD